MRNSLTKRGREQNHFNRKTAAAILIIAIAAAVLIFAAVRAARRRSYSHIDLPIVLGNEEEVVDTIREGLTDRHDEVTITFSAKGQYRDQITALADGLFEKALDVTDDPRQGDYLRFQYGGYQVRYSNPANDRGGYDYTIRIIPTYYTNAEEEQSVDDVVSSFLASEDYRRSSSDYEKVKTTHDFLTDRCEYDWRNRWLVHRHQKSTAYGALVKGEASCQGYAVAMYRLLVEEGIGCRVITGDATSPETGKSEYHAWNLVKVDGKWYNLDASWDDETESLDYFLKSDASFSSHVREEQYDSAEFRAEYPVSQSDYKQD